jgi:hypothetical protein
MADEVAVYVRLAIHTPNPGYERAIIDSMHRLGDAVRGRPGIREVHTLSHRGAGRLIGLAICESEEAWLAARDEAAGALAGADFARWEQGDPVIFALDEA